jgi:hypothetical protein
MPASTVRPHVSHARFVQEARLKRSESSLALAAIAGLSDPARAEAVLALTALARRHRVPNVAATLRQLGEPHGG